MTTKQDIIALLETNDRAVARALVVLNERQTRDEQDTEATRHHNGIGFTGCDARMGTSMAKFYTRNGYLTAKQLAYWRKPNIRGVARIVKYAGQLLEIAQEKAQAQLNTSNSKPAQGELPVPSVRLTQDEMAELEMNRMEARADRLQTIQEELAKYAARRSMERGAA